MDIRNGNPLGGSEPKVLVRLGKCYVLNSIGDSRIRTAQDLDSIEFSLVFSRLLKSAYRGCFICPVRRKNYFYVMHCEIQSLVDVAHQWYIGMAQYVRNIK